MTKKTQESTVRFVPTKSRGLAIVLALILGGLGAQWFYLERPWRGLVYILFCWTLIPSILALIEIIVWASMPKESWDEKYNGKYYAER